MPDSACRAYAKKTLDLSSTRSLVDSLGHTLRPFCLVCYQFFDFFPGSVRVLQVSFDDVQQFFSWPSRFSLLALKFPQYCLMGVFWGSRSTRIVNFHGCNSKRLLRKLYMTKMIFKTIPDSDFYYSALRYEYWAF